MMRHGSRSCGVMFGIILALIGAIQLSARAGWFDTALFWPTAFLAMGSVIVVLSLTKERKSRTYDTQDREGRNHDSASPKI
jgi:hypothetical protein